MSPLGKASSGFGESPESGRFLLLEVVEGVSLQSAGGGGGGGAVASGCAADAEAAGVGSAEPAAGGVRVSRLPLAVSVAAGPDSGRNARRRQGGLP